MIFNIILLFDRLSLSFSTEFPALVEIGIAEPAYVPRCRCKMRSIRGVAEKYRTCGAEVLYFSTTLQEIGILSLMRGRNLGCGLLSSLV